jgi:hypothetical protein
MKFFPAGSLLFSVDSFFVDFFFLFFFFLAFFDFLSSFSAPTAESIVFVSKNNDDEQGFREFTGDCLFISVSFTVNHDPASSLFADEFQESKTKKAGARIQCRIRNLVDEFHKKTTNGFAKITVLYSYPNLRPRRWFLKVRENSTQRLLEICLLGVTTDSRRD